MNTTFTKLTAALALLFAAGSLTAGEKSSLDGKWRLDYWPQGDTPIVSPADARQVGMKTIDATVPGNVELDLLAAGLIEQPEIGSNVYDLRPWEGYQWRYSRTFTTPEHADGDHIQLNFNGIDCYADVWVNGRQVDRPTTCSSSIVSTSPRR